MTITCDYTPTSQSADDKIAPRFVVNHAEITFDPQDGNYMLIDLTFTNEGNSRSFKPPVYIAVDDDQGRNYVRRPLPSVDFSRIAPGESCKFFEKLFISRFRRGHYTVHLWIPGPNPALKFSEAHNFLLSSVGVADPVTRLNILADFTIYTTPVRKHPAR